MKRNNFLSLVAIIGIVFVALIGCGQLSTDHTTGSKLPTDQTDQTIHYKTYVNQRFGFSVQYPSTWEIGSRPTNGDGRYFSTPSNVSSFDNGYSSGVSKADVLLLAVGTTNAVMGVGQGYDFKQMVTVFKKFFATERKAPGVVSESYTIIPNKWIIDTSIQRMGQNGMQYSKTFTNLETNQSISLMLPVSQADKYELIYKHIAASFKPGNRPG